MKTIPILVLLALTAPSSVVAADSSICPALEARANSLEKEMSYSMSRAKAPATRDDGLIDLQIQQNEAIQIVTLLAAKNCVVKPIRADLYTKPADMCFLKKALDAGPGNCDRSTWQRDPDK